MEQLEELLRDMAFVRSVESSFLARAAADRLPLSFELAYSSRHDITSPAVLLVWRRNRGAIVPAFAEQELRADLRRWCVPKELSEAVRSTLQAAPGGVRLFVRCPSRQKPNALSVYLEFTRQFFSVCPGGEEHFWNWLSDSVVGDVPVLQAAAGYVQEAMRRAVFRGLLVSWNIDHGLVTSRDVYLTTPAQSHGFMLPLLGEVAPATFSGLWAQLLGLSMFAVPGLRVFSKLSSSGAVSCHVKGLLWQDMERIESRVHAAGLVRYLRGRYSQAPAIFSLSALPDGRQYCSAYVQYYSCQPWG